jgi:hypothetical protein
LTNQEIERHGRGRNRGGADMGGSHDFAEQSHLLSSVAHYLLAVFLQLTACLLVHVLVLPLLLSRNCFGRILSPLLYSRGMDMDLQKTHIM